MPAYRVDAESLYRAAVNDSASVKTDPRDKDIMNTALYTITKQAAAIDLVADPQNTAQDTTAGAGDGAVTGEKWSDYSQVFTSPVVKMAYYKRLRDKCTVEGLLKAATDSTNSPSEGDRGPSEGTRGDTVTPAEPVLGETHHLSEKQKVAMQQLLTSISPQPYSVRQPQSAVTDMQNAHQVMNQFLPPQPVAGQGVAPTGLDAPRDTRAAPMPGVPGHAATNVIDRMGGLDPRGQTVDGNNAAGVPKGFKLAADKEMTGTCAVCGAGGLDDGATICADCEPAAVKAARTVNKNQKQAAEMGEHGLVGTGIADTAGHATTALSIVPWLAAGTSAFKNPRKDKQTHEDTLRQLESVRPDALSDTELRLGSPNLWQDMIWKAERNGEELPWHKQLGGRVLQNRRTGPLGKLVGWPTSPLRWAMTSLGRGPHYDPYSDTAHNPWNNKSVTEHELGHAIDINSLTNKGKIPKGLLGRLGAGTVRDLYTAAYSVPFVNLYHENEANRESGEALKEAIKNKEEFLARVRDRAKVLPAAYGSYVGGNLGKLTGPAGAAVGPLVGTMVGRSLGRDKNYIKDLLARRGDDWDRTHGKDKKKKQEDKKQEKAAAAPFVGPPNTAPYFDRLAEDGAAVDEGFAKFTEAPISYYKSLTSLNDEYMRRHGRLLNAFPETQRFKWLSPTQKPHPDSNTLGFDAYHDKLKEYVSGQRELADKHRRSYDLVKKRSANARNTALATTGGGALAGGLLANFLHKRYRGDEDNSWERPLATLAGGVGGGALGYGLSHLLNKNQKQANMVEEIPIKMPHDPKLYEMLQTFGYKPGAGTEQDATPEQFEQLRQHLGWKRQPDELDMIEAWMEQDDSAPRAEAVAAQVPR